MSEDFLHYLWKFKLFTGELQTSEGDPVQVLNCGTHNTDAGPDFFNAKVKIGNTTWAGNVELHIKSSDWNQHGHEHNKAYKNIILHVVYEADAVAKGISKVPLVELKNKFHAELWTRYESFLKNKDWIPCAKIIHTANDFTITNWLDRMLVERLEQKTILIGEQIKQNKNNWEETFYQCLARNFGFKLNALPFELLAKSLPLIYLGKHKNSLLQIEALLMGQAGFLDEKFTNDYPKELKREYDFLKNKFQLNPVEKHLWKFARTRPVNFPTIRIAQFAMLVFKSSHLLSIILETTNQKAFYKLFDMETSAYWKTHYRFDHAGKKSEKHIGKTSIDNILINTVAPFLFFYGRQKENEEVKNRAIKLLETLPPENNVVLKNWKQLKINATSSGTSQALLQLKNEYCTKKKCLHCGIGIKLLK